MAPLGPFGRDRRVVVAVSGGADSMALAILLARWGQPIAVIVDHGLRPEAAAEAAVTKARLAAAAIPALIVRAGLQKGPAAAERARAARYGLLLAACRALGRPDLLVAHHQDDQAETVRMREQAGSGGAGLAGMAAVTFAGEARIVRPLLGVGTARLRETLRATGVDWVEDPTNTDLRTERARLRAGMDFATRRNALRLSVTRGRGRQQDEARLAEELAAVSVYPEGYAIAPAPLSDPALSALIWSLSGRSYPPPRAALTAGLAARTVHGVLIRPAGRLGSGTLIAREPDAVAAPVHAWPSGRWDGRFRAAGVDDDEMQIGALGEDAAGLRAWSALPSVVLRTLPALRRRENLVAVPHLRFPNDAACRSVRLWFDPRRPIAGAPFMPAGVNPSEGWGM